MLVILLILFLLPFLIPSGQAAGDRCAGIIDQAWKDPCYRSLALEKGNYSFCEKIARENTRVSCYFALFSSGMGEPAMCDSLSGMDKDACYMSFVGRSGEPSLCDKLSPSMADSCVISLALNKSDVSICNRLSSEASQMTCRTTVLGALLSASPSPSTCDNVSGFERDICLHGLAKRLNNDTICSLIADANIRSACETKLTPGYCETLPQASIRDICFASLANSESNPSFCERIATLSFKDACFLSVAQRTGNSSLCSNIATESLRSQCFQLPKT